MLGSSKCLPLPPRRLQRLERGRVDHRVVGGNFRFCCLFGLIKRSWFSVASSASHRVIASIIMGRDVGPGAQTRVLTSWQSGVIETPVATAHAHTAVALHSPLSTFALGAKPGRHIGLSVGSMELRHGAGAAAIVTCCSRGPLPRIFIFELVEGILSLIILVVLSRGEGIVERIELPVIRGLGHQGGRAPRHQLAMVFANTPCETKSENGFTANCQIDLSCHGAAVQSENLAQSAILDRGGNQQTAHTASLSHLVASCYY